MVESHQPPGHRSSLAIRVWDFKRTISYYLFTISCFAGSLISTYRKFFPILDSRITVHESDFQLKASFCFEIISLLCAVVRLRERRVNKKENDQAERVISTPELNMLPCLHPEPINVVVYHDPSGRSHLGIGLALRCFQHLSFPNIATQHCS
jgi:hypothetical protein